MPAEEKKKKKSNIYMYIHTFDFEICKWSLEIAPRVFLHGTEELGEIC